MNSSSLKRVLSMICVFALMIGMVSASALGAPLMTGEAVAEIPVLENGPVQSARVDVEPERPAVQVGAQNAPTDEDSAQLMAAKMVYNVTTDGTAGNSQFTFTSVNAQSKPSTLTHAGLTLNKAVKMESSTSISFTAAGAGTLTIVVDGANGKSVKVDGTKCTVDTNLVEVDLAAGTHTITKGDTMNLYYISFGSDCEHDYQVTSTNPATCTVDGSKVSTCSKCGDTQTETLKAPGHDWSGEKTVITPSTCKVAGKQSVKCANCTETKEEALPLAAHTDADGNHVCDVCGNCDHKYTETVTKAATCTAAGTKTVKCDYCGDSRTETIEATGHKWNDDGTCANGCGEVKNTSFIAAAGWLESAYALWPIDKTVSKYTASYKEVGGEYKPVDDQLIRQYPGYMRVDVLGLVGNKSYVIKIEDNKGGSMETEALAVKPHDRSGFAFVNGTASGAYNDDGSLKANAEVIYVTKASDLDGKIEKEIWNNTKNKFTSNPVCVRVIGHVTMSGAMGFQGWTTGLTVEGVGNDALLTGGGVFVKGSSNVEVRNLGVMHVQTSGKNDLIAVEQTNDHVWVHNNDLFYGFAGSGDQAKGDGSLDVKDATYCSFSYNHFWDSGKACLLGNSSNENYITYHHNWFDHSDSRSPRTRSGNVHVYNNYYDGVSKYGVGTTGGCGPCSVFIEANYFRNTKYPILNSTQASDSDGKGGTNTFFGDGPGFNKAYNNVMVGSKNFVSQLDDPNSFDAYVVTSRDEKVPSDVNAGGSTYSNFDTTTDLGIKTPVQDPKDAMVTVTQHAGRVGGGDIKWEFDDATEDNNYAVIDAFATQLNNYETTLQSVGGTVTASATTTEHVHRPGTWITTKAPGCDPATKKVVDGTETRFCIDCGEEMDSRKVDGAHSNDGQGECTVCHEKVANGGGPVISANSKVLKASDFKSVGKKTPMTQAMLDEKYNGYFTLVGSVAAGGSSSNSEDVDHLSLSNSGNAGISFTIKNGPADVSVKASSTGKANTSEMVLKDASGKVVAEKNGQTIISVSKNVGDAQTVSYSLPAGTYTVYSNTGLAQGIRLVQLVVTEAEATCEHANRTEVPAVAAECEKAGNIQYWVCDECGKYFDAVTGGKELTEAQVVIAAKQHNYGSWTMVNADGHKRVCANDADHVEMAAHTEATRTKGETTATCTTPGSYTLETYCTVCNGVIKTENKTNVLAPHKLTETKAKAATCVAAGNIAYWTCSECHKTFSDAAGETEVTNVTLAVDPNAHGETKLVGAKEATTAEDGYTGDKVCTLCEKVVEQGTVIPKIVGSMSKLLKGSDQDTQADIKALKDAGTDVTVKNWATDTTAYKMGGNDTVKNFFTVHYSAASKIDTTEKTWDFEGNYYTTGVAKKESRFSFGGKAQPSKSLKNTIEFTTTKPATVKIWWVQAGGTDPKTGETVAIRNIALWDSAKAQKWTSKSTATEKNSAEFDEVKNLAAGTYYLGGVDTNYFFMVEVIEEGDIARTWAKPVDPDPTCTHANKTHTDAVEAECEKAGNIEYWTCPDCGKNFKDEACTEEVTNVTVAAKGHDMQVTTPAVPATCKTEGKTAVKTCANGCGKTEGGTAVAKLPHTEATRQKNVTNATCTVPGDYDEETYCTVCDTVIKTEHKTGVTLPHDLKEVPGTAKAPTATEAGKEADKKCANCDYTEVGKAIPALGEEPVVVDKAALTKAIDKANAAKKTATVSKDGSNVSKSAKWVTEAEMKALTDAIAAAQAVKDKTDAIQKDVDDQVTALTKAMADFEAAKKAGTYSGGGGSVGGGSGSYRPSNKQEDLDDQKTPLAGGPELNSKDHTAYITGYPDGTVGAERSITRQEAAAIFYRLLTEQSKAVYGSDKNDFSDIGADHWANSAISTLANAGIVKGLPDGTFGAEQTITRAEFVTMAARFYTVSADLANPFPDVDGNWAEKEILFAYSKGWVKGLPDGSFGPDQLITRAEAMRIINNVLDRAVDAEGVVKGVKEFDDVSESAWYYYDVMEATNGHTYDRRNADATVENWKELLSK